MLAGGKLGREKPPWRGRRLKAGGSQDWLPHRFFIKFRGPKAHANRRRIMRKSLIRGYENRGRGAVNPVTDGAGSGFRKDGGTHASLVCHRGRLAFSRESPVCGIGGRFAAKTVKHPRAAGQVR